MSGMAPLALGLVDSSVFISLGRIERLSLLDGHFEQLLAPETVRREVGELPTFVQVVSDVSIASTSLRLPALDPGEVQVIVNAFAHPDAWLLLDDLAARQFAEAHGFKIMGTPGVILRCKRQGRIASARPVLHELQDAGMFISDDLIARALALVGE